MISSYKSQERLDKTAQYNRLTLLGNNRLFQLPTLHYRVFGLLEYNKFYLQRVYFHIFFFLARVSRLRMTQGLFLIRTVKKDNIHKTFMKNHICCIHNKSTISQFAYTNTVKLLLIAGYYCNLTQTQLFTSLETRFSKHISQHSLFSGRNNLHTDIYSLPVKYKSKFVLYK